VAGLTPAVRAAGPALVPNARPPAAVSDARPPTATDKALADPAETMPLLQFDTTLSPAAAEKTAFAEEVTGLYTEEMATTAGHVAVTIRERDEADMHIGRGVEGPLLFLDAEIRRGRSAERKRAFALAVMSHAGDAFGVPDPNMKVVFTEHPGDAMMGVDRVGGEWDGE